MERKQLTPYTYTGVLEGEQSGIGKIIRKVIRKTINWYLYPWGARQNDFNVGVCEELAYSENIISGIKETIADLEEIIESQKIELRDLRGEHERKIGLLQKQSREIYNTHAVQPVLCDLHEFIENRERNLSEDDLKHIDSLIKEDIKTQLLSKEQKSCIVVMCENFNVNRYSEAVRKETFAIYNELRQQSKYDVRLVSLEKGSILREDADIAYVGEDRIIEYLGQMKIAVIFWNCPCFLYAHAGHGVFKKYVSIFRFTNQNPLQCNEPMTEEYYRTSILPLCHLNDFGFLNVMTLSEKAKEILEESGFKNVGLSKPQGTWKDVSFKQHDYNGEDSFVIGLASSPMHELQMEDRGMDLLLNIAKQDSSNRFVLLWRDENVEVPLEIKSSNNIVIRYGVCDMEKFYEEIDCLLIPYQSKDNNHACSLSAIEAMLSGVPVVTTEIAGVSDYVRRCGMGLATGNDASSVVTTIAKLRNNYNYYSKCENRENLLLLLEDNLVWQVEKVAESYRPNNIVTLDEWRIQVEEKGKELVIGQDEIKKYYSQFEVAKHYNHDRFIQYPENCFDTWERSTIDILIERKKNNEEISILDIAPGDGRILQEDLKYGECVGMDASAAMLNLVKERFEGFSNLKTVEGDYFVDEIQQKFDIITTFRYIRHFTYKDRKRLYKKICSNLKQDGVLIFDVPNIAYECKQREINQWGNFNIYDMFWTKESIVSELEENGFRVDMMIEVGNGLTIDSDEPMTWTIAAIKN